MRIPAYEYRSIPRPSGEGKVGLFFARADAVSAELAQWKDVNPREVKTSTSVYKDILSTLTDEPTRFADRNRGLTLSAAEVDYDAKRREVVITLVDRQLHGVVDGGHTLHAILAAQSEPPEGDWKAEVFFKVITGVDSNQIVEIAGGLNSSQVVDIRSLQNLEGHFATLKEALKNEPYANDIAYKMNELKPIDVREILYYLAVFDCDAYSDDRHPTALFGRKEGIVRTFAEQFGDGAKNGSESFKILITKAPEILRLRDLVEKKALQQPIGRFKAGKDGVRVRSRKNANNDLMFLGEKVKGTIPLGWIMPMLAAFRANVNWNKPKGTFTWKADPETVLDSCIGSLVDRITEIHASEGSRPEYVGRNATAWRTCYERVQIALLRN
ncbi:MAG: AIPR family protein [Planctomycetia bacterium]|nr:AIPR family protein [Planctomycetia bacterium]